jgi:plastocyanin domain-containing protein
LCNGLLVIGSLVYWLLLKKNPASIKKRDFFL